MTVVSDIEGRLRIRDELLKDRSTAEAVSKALLSCRGVNEVSYSEKVGSLLIQYSGSNLGQTEIKNIIAGFLKESVGESTYGGRGIHVGRHPLSAISLNKRKLVHFGMLSSLAVSLLGASLDVKKLHLISGIVFIGVLGLHLSSKKRLLFT